MRGERGGVLGVNKGMRGEGALNGKPAVLLQALAINGVAYSQSKASWSARKGLIFSPSRGMVDLYNSA